MRKFGTNKSNPNPPWPNQQSVIVVPPGSNSVAVGMEGTGNYSVTEEGRNDARQNNNTAPFVEDERGRRQEPIMGNSNQREMSPAEYRNNFQPTNMNGACEKINVSGYLCGQTGKYVKLEFLFGENTHMEKIGRLREVGKDFIAIQENGTNNIIVCGTNKIKFINIYEYGWQ